MAHSSPGGLYFAHLSDPHLSSLDGVRWRQLLSKRALGYLSWRRRRRAEHRVEVLDLLIEDLDHTRPEHIVITGDLTHTGLPDEFHQARVWLERLGAAERITVVPGNHDAYARASWSATFSLWEPFMRSDEPAADATGDSIFPSLRVRNGVALIGLSSARATAPFLATGSLGRAQLERLEVLLSRTAAERLFRILMLHHPPRREDEGWRKRLTDAEALCAVLERAGADLVLHGHMHRSLHTELRLGRRRIPVFGIPSASASGAREGRRAQYYLYRISPEAAGWSVQVTVRGYRPDEARFQLEHEHHLLVPSSDSTSR
ncbi:MAG: metallophosphoesterase [Gammaproteobacteria bacterium]|jgi:3',5'-cyclic AMP phosphodiesterase CpdA